MQRNKTQRRKVPPTPTPDIGAGPFQGDSAAKATEESLDAFLNADLISFNQPWSKLDRGSRLDRLRKFVQLYPELSMAERANLLSSVLQAFELRHLNTKVAVEYDPLTATIQSIRGLKERTGLNGLRTFRIENSGRVATLKRKPASVLNTVTTENQ